MAIIVLYKKKLLRYNNMYDHDRIVTSADILDTDYVFVEKDPNETSYVRLTGETPWRETVFQYGNIKLLTPETAKVDNATLSFSYNIIESVMNEDCLKTDRAFKNYIGAVLEHILTNAFETGEYKLGSDDSDNDTAEPTTQRAVHSQGSTLS